MKIGSTFYLSRVLGNRVYTPNGEVVGRLKDFVVDADAIRPKVIAARIRGRRESRFVAFEALDIEKVNAQYRVTCSDVTPVSNRAQSTFMLAKHVLDKQLIDVDGRKLVRVNDLRLATLSGGTYVIAVDVGFEGFLRRLGVAKPIKRLLKPLRLSIPSNLLLWDEVETVDFGQKGIRLSKGSSKLATMHPSDLADILEELDVKSQLDVFTSLDEETKLDVLEEMETEAQVSVVEQLTVPQAAAILEKLPSDEAADILEELEEDRANQIMEVMHPASTAAIRTLLQYPEDSVGSVMTTDYVAFAASVTAGEALAALRTMRPEADRMYYLYVVNQDGRLAGAVSLGDVILAEPSERLGSLADENIVSVQDTDDEDVLFDVFEKYNLLAVPVVDDTKTLVGMVTVNDVLSLVKRSRRGRF
ncbi:membrane protein [Alicyclobacillus contaminans]|uniref:magnesium transporter n=1 Tax=Alicyclobacillus contaminans TaxID=392016 RepID=UPI0003FEA127|nr:CBS domain-containing protein [Alicyclobacillus contaminans]GMA51026.1 membrane protein [Alicyclobacillus contaminans]